MGLTTRGKAAVAFAVFLVFVVLVAMVGNGPNQSAGSTSSPTPTVSESAETLTPEPVETETEVPEEASPIPTPTKPQTREPAEEVVVEEEPTIAPQVTEEVTTFTATAEPEYERELVILNKDTKEPISGATVMVALYAEGNSSARGLPFISDENGKVLLEDIPEGRTGILSVYSDECQTQSYSFSIMEEEGIAIHAFGDESKEIHTNVLLSCGSTPSIPEERQDSYVLTEGCGPQDPSCAMVSAMAHVPGAISVISCEEVMFSAPEGTLQAYRAGSIVAFAPLDRPAEISGYVCEVQTAKGSVVIGVAYLCANPFILEGKPPVKRHPKPLPPPDCLEVCEPPPVPTPEPTPTPDRDCHYYGTCPAPVLTCTSCACNTPGGPPCSGGSSGPQPTPPPPPQPHQNQDPVVIDPGITNPNGSGGQGPEVAPQATEIVPEPTKAPNPNTDTEDQGWD